MFTTYITDTTFIIDSNFIYYHLPYDYSYNDPMATINWENSQVLNLFYKRKANCFALASLYKIFAERLNTDANLGLAPGHIYITHNDVKDINYNVELASRRFPGAGSIMTLTYSSVDAVQSGIAMRTLDLKQSVALCLVYLAKGYEHKFNTKTDNFIYQCAEATLKYDSLNLNAMLLKAEVLEESILSTKKTITQLQKDKQFKEYEKLIAKLYVQGYRQMPLDMKNLIVNKLQKDSITLIQRDHTPNGFQSIKPTDDRYATLSWGAFDEVQEPKLIEHYNRALFNTKTKKITKFVTEDILYNKYNFDPVVTAWQVDPLSAKYPNISPYSAFNNSPILYNDPTGESGEVAINKQSKTITISATVVLYGSEANKFLASTTANDIQKQINDAHGKVAIDGTTYTVKAKITGVYKEDNKALKEEIVNNKEIKNNYYRVESNTDEGVSYNDKHGSTGFFKRGEIEENGSTTETHEFIHGLGLDHNSWLQTDIKGQPEIMDTRGNNAEKPYALSDGTLNANTRKVTQKTIDKIFTKDIKDGLKKYGKGGIGNQTNTYHEKPEK